jgi:hypothetical protein
MDSEQSPEFMTEVFHQFQDLLQEALVDQNDIQQITTYLEMLGGALHSDGITGNAISQWICDQFKKI